MSGYFELVHFQQTVNAETYGCKASKTGVEAAESPTMGRRNPKSIHPFYKAALWRTPAAQHTLICFSVGCCMRPAQGPAFLLFRGNNSIAFQGKKEENSNL